MVNLNSCPYVTPLEVKSIPNLKGGLWLRGTDEQLLLINAIGNNHEVYELNFLKMEWMKMQNFGDQALFLDYYKGGLGFSNKTRWKDSETPFNGRYCFDRDNTDIWFHFMDGRRDQSFPFMGRKCMPNTLRFKPSWYFPHESCNVIFLSRVKTSYIHYPYHLYIE